MDQRHDYQDRQEDQKNGGQHLADVGENFARIEREAQHQRKEDQRENRQRQPLLLGGQQAGYRHGEGHRRAARDGEEGADGQVQRAGEKVAVGAADLGAELKQAVAATDADGRYAQQRHADARDDKAGDGLPDIAARQLSHINWENQIPRAKKHAEQHRGDQQRFSSVQSLLHCDTPRLRIFSQFITSDSPCTRRLPMDLVFVLYFVAIRRERGTAGGRIRCGLPLPAPLRPGKAPRRDDIPGRRAAWCQCSGYGNSRAAPPRADRPA